MGSIEIKSEELLNIFKKYEEKGLRFNIYTFVINESYLPKYDDAYLSIKIEGDYSKFNRQICSDLTIEIRKAQEGNNVCVISNFYSNSICAFKDASKIHLLADFMEEIKDVDLEAQPEYARYVQTKMELRELEKRTEETLKKLEDQKKEAENKINELRKQL
mgnify:CR=1 FL=1